MALDKRLPNDQWLEERAFLLQQTLQSTFAEALSSLPCHALLLFERTVLFD